MMMSIMKPTMKPTFRPSAGHCQARTASEKTPLAAGKAISASAFQPSQLPSVSFGNNDDPSN
jgi:hypothetical protein